MRDWGHTMTVRALALELYQEVIDDKAYSNIVLNEALRFEELNNEDRGLLTELLYGTLQHKLTLEYYIKPFIKTKLKAWQRHLLHMSVYQFEYLDRVPDYAVINEAVEIAKDLGGLQASKQINGILRAYLRGERPDFDHIKDDAHRLSLKYSMPKWVIRHWFKHYSYDETEKILAALNKRPQMSLRTNKKLIDRQDLINRLNEEGYQAETSDLHEDAIKVKGQGITRSQAYKDGLFAIQDVSSMFVQKALNPSDGDTILDACAAPGGKGMHALESMEGGFVSFGDLHEHKIALIDNEGKRLKHTNYEAFMADAAKDDYGGTFDRIIVDAPCSGLGVVKRKPEIKYERSSETIESLVELQLEILDNVKKYLKPNGVLIYSTCTIHQLENENVAYTFKKKHADIDFDDFTLEAFDFKGPYKQILPYEHDTDGFFIARFKKTES